MSEEMKNRPEAGKQAGSCPGDRTADGRQSDAEPELCEDLRQYVTQVNRNIRNAANACQKTIMDTLEDQRVQRFIARHLAPRCGIQGSYYGIAPAPDPNPYPGGPQKDVPAPGFLWSFDTELFPDNPEKTGTVEARPALAGGTDVGGAGESAPTAAAPGAENRPQDNIGKAWEMIVEPVRGRGENSFLEEELLDRSERKLKRELQRLSSASTQDTGENSVGHLTLVWVVFSGGEKNENRVLIRPKSVKADSAARPDGTLDGIDPGNLPGTLLQYEEVFIFLGDPEKTGETGPDPLAEGLSSIFWGLSDPKEVERRLAACGLEEPGKNRLTGVGKELMNVRMYIAMQVARMAVAFNMSSENFRSVEEAEDRFVATVDVQDMRESQLREIFRLTRDELGRCQV